MSSREAFLQRVQKAVSAGNAAGSRPALPQWGKLGYQGGGADPASRFCTELAAAGGTGYLAQDRDHVLRILFDILRKQHARKLILGRGGLLDRLELAPQLRACGFEVHTVDNLPANSSKEILFGADVGISNVYRLVAETGTVVMATRPHEPRSLSLLPPVHIALAETSQLLPDLFDLFDLFSPIPDKNRPLPPACLSLITGPSKTGDIELKLVTGVHGPGEVHVILLGHG